MRKVKHVWMTLQEEMKTIRHDLDHMQKTGVLRPIIAAAYRFEDVTQAHVDVIETSGAKGKIVVNIIPEGVETVVHL